MSCYIMVCWRQENGIHHKTPALFPTYTLTQSSLEQPPRLQTTHSSTRALIHTLTRMCTCTNNTCKHHPEAMKGSAVALSSTWPAQ